MKTCHKIEELGVKLQQTGIDRFTVTYGKQVKRGLDYRDAALEYGSCIMHAFGRSRNSSQQQSSKTKPKLKPKGKTK